MIAALYPSAREKMLEVNHFRCLQMGLSPRKDAGVGDILMMSAPPASPRRSPRSKENAPKMPLLENTWAMRSGRTRVIHDRRTWAMTAISGTARSNESEKSPTNGSQKERSSWNE